MGSTQFKFQIQNRQLLCCFVSSIILLDYDYYFGGQVLAAGSTLAPNFINKYYCGGDSYTSTSQFQSNLNLLFSSLSSEVTVAAASGKKFYNKSIGGGEDLPGDNVYGVSLCRGDITMEICKTCVDWAVKTAPEDCPDKKIYIIWYEYCMLRYSNTSFLSVMEIQPEALLNNINNNSNPEDFNNILKVLMDSLVTKAAAGGGVGGGSSYFNTKFATGEANFTDLHKIYGLAQCTPDISENDCNKCLRGAVGKIPICCYAAQGGIVLRPSCSLRFETYAFFDESNKQTSTSSNPAPAAQAPLISSSPPLPAISSPPPRPPNATTAGEISGKKSFKNVVIASVTATALILLSIVVIWFICLRKKKKEDDKSDMSSYKFKTIVAATNNFSDKLGSGGFGVVYKGKLKSTGEYIAVKRGLFINSEQGEKEFKTEAELLHKLKHGNLVRLKGFCSEGPEKLLIYELVENGSLDKILFDRTKRAPILKWETRYNIIKGIARGVYYIHKDPGKRVVHRDLKASNILLDANMEPKISDFGLAKLFEMDKSRVFTKPSGTSGYMAPEVFQGQISLKSDVYSFGVLLLEIVTGKSVNQNKESGPAHEKLLSYVQKHWEGGSALDLIDQTITDSYSDNEVKRCIQIGLLCVQEAADKRPTMESIDSILSSVDVALPAVVQEPSPSQPEIVTVVDPNHLQQAVVDIPTKENKSMATERSDHKSTSSSSKQQYGSDERPMLADHETRSL